MSVGLVREVGNQPISGPDIGGCARAPRAHAGRNGPERVSQRGDCRPQPPNGGGHGSGTGHGGELSTWTVAFFAPVGCDGRAHWKGWAVRPDIAVGAPCPTGGVPQPGVAHCSALPGRARAVWSPCSGPELDHRRGSRPRVWRHACACAWEGYPWCVRAPCRRSECAPCHGARTQSVSPGRHINSASRDSTSPVPGLRSRVSGHAWCAGRLIPTRLDRQRPAGAGPW